MHRSWGRSAATCLSCHVVKSPRYRHDGRKFLVSFPAVQIFVAPNDAEDEALTPALGTDDGPTMEVCFWL